MLFTRDSILEIARGLPAGLREMEKLEQLQHRRDDPRLDEVEELVRGIPGLAAVLLQVSNSIAFGGDQRTGSVEEALARLGLKEAFLITGDCVTHGLWEEPLTHYGVTGPVVAQHCARAAFYSERLALDLKLDPGKAHLAGLLAPIGMWVLERAARQAGNVEAFDVNRDGDVRTWELRTFGYDAAQVGAWVLTRRGFPADLAAALGHQRLAEADDLRDRLAVVLNLARGAAAEDAGDAFLGERPYWQVTPRNLAAVGLSTADFGRAIGAIREEFRQAEEHPLRRAMAAHRASVAAPEGRLGPAEDSCNFRPGSGVLPENDAPSVHTSDSGVTPVPDFPTFMRNYQNMVFSTAARLTGNDAQAEDISQEVFLKAYDHFENLRTSPTAGGWLKTVATNLSLNHLARYRKRWRFFSEFRRDFAGDDGGDSPVVDFAAPDTFFGDIDAEDRRVVVEQALAQLPPNQRVPLVLFHFEDMPYDEIAKKLGISLAKVKTDILRARAALAKILVRRETAHEPFKL